MGKKETLKSVYDLLKWTETFQNKNLKEIRSILDWYDNKVIWLSRKKDVEKIIKAVCLTWPFVMQFALWNSRLWNECLYWVLPLVTWIDGFSDWISMECMFKILQFHNLWDNECKMDEYCFRFALWRWNSPFVEASAEHKWSERFIAMFNATKHNIRPFHIHVFVNMSDCNILFITEIIKFNLKIRNTTYRRQFISETPLTPDRF